MMEDFIVEEGTSYGPVGTSTSTSGYRRKDRHKQRQKSCEICGKEIARTRYSGHILLCRRKRMNTSGASRSSKSNSCDIRVGNFVGLGLGNRIDDGGSDSDSDDVNDADLDSDERQMSETDYDEDINGEDSELIELLDIDDNTGDDVDVHIPEDVTYLEPLKAHLLQLLQLQSTHSLSDTGFEAIWKCFISLAVKIFTGQKLDEVELLQMLPRSLFSIRKLLDIHRDSMTKYVMCPKCHTRYSMSISDQGDDNRQTVTLSRNTENGVHVTSEIPGGCRETVHVCDSVKDVNHRLQRFNTPCGEELMKPRFSKLGVPFPSPKKLFCYQSVKDSLRRLYNLKSNFSEQLEHWRNDTDCTMNHSPDKVLCDIYDGQVWADLQDVNGSPFLSEPDNLAFMVNIDWFQPFKHTTYSVGAIYLVIMNLPRDVRFLVENIIVVGIIDGPHEPNHYQICNYLHPLVSEMEDLWDGVWIEDKNSILGRRRIRAAVLCLSSDIMATRKVGGFVGHGGNKGCSKCTRSFPRIGTTLKADYSDFESPMPARDAGTHVQLAEATRNARTLTERKALEAQDGVRWTPLFNLPIFDPIRMHVVDPMHNLSGIVSHTMGVWKELEIISKNNLPAIQAKMDSIKVPTDVGRIPHKIESNFSGFTADQLIHWTLIYSTFCLKGHIEECHLNIWRLFVAACRLICRTHISVADARVATQLLRHFCVAFRDTYGIEKCTPNMHLSLHLESCIVDYGSVFSFWCFSFERFNGMFEHFPTNKRDIPLQLLRRFIQTQEVSLKLSELQNRDDLFVAGIVDNSRGARGTLGQIHGQSWKDAQRLSTVTEPVDFTCSTKLTGVVGRPTEGIFTSDVSDRLFSMIRFLYPLAQRISHSYQTYTKCTIGGKTVTVQRHERDRSCCIDARWVSMTDGEPAISLDTELRPGYLTKIYKFSILFDALPRKEIIVGEVSWMVDSPHRYHYGRSAPVSVWSKQLVDARPCSFIPISRVTGRCAHLQTKIDVGQGRAAASVTVVISL